MLRYIVQVCVLLAWLLAGGGCESNRYQLQSGSEWERQTKSHSSWQSDSASRKRVRFDEDMRHLRELNQQGKWELAEQFSMNIVYSSPEEWDLAEVREIGARARRELAKDEMPRIGAIRILDLSGNVRMNFVWCPPTQSWQWRLLSGGNMSVPLVLSPPPPPPPPQQRRTAGEKTGAGGRRQEYDLTEGFWISQTEVSQTQWEQFMRYNPSPIRGSNLPVSGISYWEAEEFADKLSERFPDKEFWIPSAKEWDYACLAGVQIAKDIRKSEWPVAEQVMLNAAGYSNLGNKAEQPHPVEQGQPNAWGIRNLIGNVQEWNSDWRGGGDEYAAASLRLARGGSWKDEALQRWLSANQ
jgi:hypothetical protein